MTRRSRGFSLLEVLVAVVILAIGLIGIAALQITTGVYNASGLHRSQAAELSREIVERMRVNLDEARAGNYDFSTLPSYTTNCEGISANCSAAELREHDLRIWAGRVNAMLPSGDAAISTTPDATDPALNPVEITVTLSWDESRGERVDDSNNVIMTQQQFVFELFGLD
jgi:type IV pilus assembly protein PilV